MALAFYRNSYATANLIDDSVFVEINRQARLFDSQFKLGSTVCQCYTVKTIKGGLGTFDKIVAREKYGSTTNNVYLFLDSVDTSEDLYDTYVLCDAMLKFNQIYDGSILTNNGETSVLYSEIIADICSQVGVEWVSASYNGPDRYTSTFDTTTPARDYISWFAELNGGYASINSSGKLRFDTYGVTDHTGTITAEECSSIKVGEHHNFKRFVFDNYDVHFEAGLSTGETLYLNPSNRYIIEQSDVDYIEDACSGYLDFYNVKIERCPIPEGVLHLGRYMEVMLNSSTYCKFIIQFDQSYYLGWQGGFECWLDNAEQVETQIQTQTDKQRIMEVKYDAELNQFSRTISDMDDTLNAKITSTASQTANEIREEFSVPMQVLKDGVESVEWMTTYISRTANGLVIGKIPEGEGSANDNIRMELSNTALNFINKDDEVLAKLDANEGLVAAKLAVGSPTEGNKRWQFIVWGDNNTHLRIAKHN